MTDSNAFDFTKFVPGFDFLKNLTPHAPATGTGAPGWVAPTLDPKEIDKRIQELKTVQFWLEQNAKGIAATIQAMEVQRMTLSTLQSMNVGMADVAAAMSGKAAGKSAAPDKDKSAAPAVDPMQWWGAIGQQFQTIASQAVEDMQKHAGAFNASAPSAKPAKKTAAPARKPAAKKTSRSASAAPRKKAG